LQHAEGLSENDASVGAAVAALLSTGLATRGVTPRMWASALPLWCCRHDYGTRTRVVGPCRDFW
jgi:hypothetical protein